MDNEHEEGLSLPNAQELGEMLHKAIADVDMEAVNKQYKRAKEMAEKFPAHAVMAQLEKEAFLIHTFIQHYLPTQGLTVAKLNPDGTLTPYGEEEGSTPVLIPKFFGVDPAQLAEEEPGVAAKVHQFESEDSLEAPDPLLAEQIKEFEQMLAQEEEAEA